jgi:hypothetical protein
MGLKKEVEVEIVVQGCRQQTVYSEVEITAEDLNSMSWGDYSDGDEFKRNLLSSIMITLRDIDESVFDEKTRAVLYPILMEIAEKFSAPRASEEKG